MTARLQRYRVNAKVLEQVEDRLKPKVLHPTLSIVGDAHSQVLRSALVVEGEHKLAETCFALAYKKDTMPRGTFGAKM